MTSQILVVDDEKDMTRLLLRSLEPELDCQVTCAFSAKMALNILGQSDTVFDLVISDIRMPEMDGFELLDRLKKGYPDLTVVMLTAYGNIESAVAAIRNGAYDFIAKPFEQDEIIYKIQKALERSRLLSENRRLQKACQSASLPLIGQSPAMQKVFEKIALVAESDVTVLITGESGTGKDLTARSIHALSPRKTNPIYRSTAPPFRNISLKVNCSGIKKGRLPMLTGTRQGFSRRPTRAPSFWMKLGM